MRTHLREARESPRRTCPDPSSAGPGRAVWLGW